jgi:hypothetical protein
MTADQRISSDGASGSDEDPLARAFGYPYPRHPGAVLFDPATGAHEARVIELGPEREHPIETLRVPVPVRALAVEVEGQAIEIDETIAIVAAGSNGSAIQLARKYRERRSGRPTLIAPATIGGAVSVYSAHIASYGSVPATMHLGPDAAVTASAHVLLMPVEELAHMNATESLGLNYVLAAPHAMRATVDRVTIDRPLAYVSLRGALSLSGGPVRLPDMGGEASGYPAASQREMLARVQAHVGDAGSLEDFVTRLIGDRTMRLAVTARLAETAERWALDRDEILADGR